MKNQPKQIQHLLTEVNCRLEHGVEDPHLQYVHEQLKLANSAPIIQEHHIADLCSRIANEFGSTLADYWNTKCVEKDLPPIYDRGDCRSIIASHVKEWSETILTN